MNNSIRPQFLTKVAYPTISLNKTGQLYIPILSVYNVAPPETTHKNRYCFFQNFMSSSLEDWAISKIEVST